MRSSGGENGLVFFEADEYLFVLGREDSDFSDVRDYRSVEGKRRCENEKNVSAE